MTKTTTDPRPASLRGKESAKLGVQHRVFEVDLNSFDAEERTVEVAFSSEDPARRWWGIEVLDHSADSVRMGRLTNGAPMLWMHNSDDQRGVVDEARIDSDRVGRALLRFGRNPDAEELFNDVRDGIKSKISVGYMVHRMVLEVETEEGPDEYRITDWEPLEISFVSIPMDDTVGVGRDAEEMGDTTETQIETKSQPVEADPPKPANPMNKTAEPADLSEEEKVKLRQQAGEDARKEELARMREIEALGDQHSQESLAREFVNNGKSVDEFKSALLEKVGTPAPVDAGLGMDPKQIKEFSLHRLLRSLAEPADVGLRESAGLEYEASKALADKYGKRAKGAFLPLDIVLGRQAEMAVAGSAVAGQFLGRRDLSVGTATAGGNTVGTNLMGSSFIEILRNVGRALRECTVMGGLDGNIAIPRHSAETIAYWIAEGGAPTEGAPTFDQVSMAPNTVGAYLDVTRKLLLQSSIDMENFTMGELAVVLGLALDSAVIKGSGVSNQPTGILNTVGIGDIAGGTNGLAPTWPHISNIKREVSKDNALLGDPMWLFNSDSVAKLEQTEKSAGTGMFILDPDRPDRRVAGYRWEETNQVPNDLTKGSGTALSALLFGNFRDCLVGLWGGLDINVDTSTHSTTGAVRIVALQDADVAVRHPQSFAAMQDAITA